MIKKFLYQMNEKNKRIITGLVEDDTFLEYDPLYEYPMILDDGYVSQEGERVHYNFGEQFYAVFVDDTGYKYLNLNDYMLKVKLDITSNAAFAATLSKDMLTAILENTSYFNIDEDKVDVDYIASGLTLKQDKEYNDFYDGWFRKVTDDVYCQINSFNKPLFVTKRQDDYELTEDFSRAYKISKREARNVVLTHSFIDKETNKKDVAFSKFNVFAKKDTYGFYGRYQSFSFKYENETLTLDKNFRPTTEYKLVSDEVRAEKLRNLSHLFKANNDGSSAYLMVNRKYVKNDGNSFLLTEYAQEATLLDSYLIDIVREAISLFVEGVDFKVITKINYFLYNEGTHYELSKEIKKNISSRVLSIHSYNDFIEAFNDNSEKKYILMSNEYYIAFKQNSNLSFDLTFESTGLNAHLFSLAQAKALSQVLGLDLKQREISKIYKSEDIYNITSGGLSVKEYYNLLESDIEHSNIRLNDYADIKQIKTESDKGSFEYLRRFYLKSMLDSYKIFKQVLSKNDSLNKILLVGITAGADLAGLSLACEELKRGISITVLETVKWGYYPKTPISNYITYDGAYRVKLEALPKEILSSFDMVYLGKNFDSNGFIDFTDEASKLDLNLLLVHTGLSLKLTSKTGLERSFDFIPSKKLISSKEDEVEALGFDLKLQITDSRLSYVEMLRLKDNRFKDLLK